MYSLALALITRILRPSKLGSNDVSHFIFSRIAATPCYDTKCSKRTAQGFEERLQSVMQLAETVNTTLRDHIMEVMKVRHSGSRVLIVTGASSDHFLEAQGLVQSLHQNVFPELDNYTFVYYDLGLDSKQREQVNK